MLKFIKNKIRESSTYRELSRMSNRELADIGISRSDIRRISKGETW